MLILGKLEGSLRLRNLGAFKSFSCWRPPEGIGGSATWIPKRAFYRVGLNLPASGRALGGSLKRPGS